MTEQKFLKIPAENEQKIDQNEQNGFADYIETIFTDKIRQIDRGRIHDAPRWLEQ